MGYRHYFYGLPKAQIGEIKQCKTNEEFCDWAESKGYEVERYDGEKPWVSVYKIGRELCEFGKYVDWAFDMQENNESIFGNQELKERYSDYAPVICTKEDFLFAINKYKEKVVAYYKGLLEGDKESRLPIEERWKRHIEGQLTEWKNGFGYCAVNTDLSAKRITDSWLYEYAIFELVRVYKTFDWQNNTLVLLGW